MVWMVWRKRMAEEIRFLWDALKKFDDDHGFFLSAGITFNLLVCLVPLILLLLAFLGSYLYSDREVLNHIRRYLENLAPSFDPKVMKNILGIIHNRKIVGILGIGGLIWASTWVFSSLRTALNIVFQVKKDQGILRGKAVDLFMIFLAGLSHLASMGLTSMVTYTQRYQFSSPIDLGPILGFFLKYFISFIFTFWMFFLIYKIIPNRKVHYKIALQAALITSILWEVAKQFFGWYVLHLGRFSMVYGSLSTLIIFFLWVYYSSVILILGGEVAFLMEKGKERSNG
jgi:membrane protein